MSHKINSALLSNPLGRFVETTLVFSLFVDFCAGEESRDEVRSTIELRVHTDVNETEYLLPQKSRENMSTRGKRARLAPSVALVLVFILSSACEEKVTSSRFEPEITNATDSFQFQVTDIRNISQITRYTWQNTGTVANVNQACSVTNGTVTLMIFDSAGKEVYSRNLSDNGTFVTGVGTTGGWTIQLVLNKCDGTLNFRAQKRE